MTIYIYRVHVRDVRDENYADFLIQGTSMGEVERKALKHAAKTADQLTKAEIEERGDHKFYVDTIDLEGEVSS